VTEQSLSSSASDDTVPRARGPPQGRPEAGVTMTAKDLRANRKKVSASSSS